MPQQEKSQVQVYTIGVGTSVLPFWLTSNTGCSSFTLLEVKFFEYVFDAKCDDEG